MVGLTGWWNQALLAQSPNRLLYPLGISSHQSSLPSFTPSSAFPFMPGLFIEEFSKISRVCIPFLKLPNREGLYFWTVVGLTLAWSGSKGTLSKILPMAAVVISTTKPLSNICTNEGGTIPQNSSAETQPWHTGQGLNYSSAAVSWHLSVQLKIQQLSQTSWHNAGTHWGFKNHV